MTTRRAFLKASTTAALAASFPNLLRGQTSAPATRSALAPAPAIPDGPFKGSRDSLSAFKVPDWYRDAKFGMWAHWGPQSAAEYGDWYARRMYVPGEPQYDYHVKTYGHPSKVGFKDVIATFHADKFDADALLARYKKAGAKYFCSMGVHHDGFDMWNSKFQPRWNAAASGPKKDIVGLFRDAARKLDLRFAISEHLSNSFSWFATAHGADKTGPLAGVPYDGTNPDFADLYHDFKDMPPDFVAKGILAAGAMTRVNYQPWVTNYYNRMIDLIDQHEPDILYTDGHIPYDDYGYNIVAHLYNTSIKRHGGNLEALYTSKNTSDVGAHICVLDVERGLVQTINPQPWQTDTCIGGWHYDKRVYDKNSYKTAKTVVDLLCDIVSRNGNLMLNVPLPNAGWPDDKELAVVDDLADWMGVNSEAIYGTRPYKILGDGPVANTPPSGRFNESSRKAMDADDVRYTTKGETLYAMVMEIPTGKEASIPSMGTGAKQGVGKIQNVELLGVGKVPFVQSEAGLAITLPEKLPCRHALAFRINGA